ncbi:MAG: hypothetical protein QM611_07265 [Microbacterium sp.]|uniref:hypothetical protein n=1 Tax=Microbacterium sp. TaxID=51671 RepID=UPI0039E2431D
MTPNKAPSTHVPVASEIPTVGIRNQYRALATSISTRPSRSGCLLASALRAARRSRSSCATWRTTGLSEQRWIWDCLALAGNAHAIYMSLDDSLRRICNQAFFDRISVYEHDGTDIVTADHGKPFDALFATALHADALAYDELVQAGADAKTALVGSLNIQHWVGAMERCGNRRPRVERLVYAWNQELGVAVEPVGEPDDPLIAAAEPRRRARTRLTEAEVDAMRTSRAQGVSVNALARRFGVHRGTVWAKTRELR